MPRIIEVMDRARLTQALITLGKGIPRFPEEANEFEKKLLEHHPFGCTVPRYSLFSHKRNIYLLGYPGYTKPSVEAMCAVLLSRIADYHPELILDVYLRIIRCELGPGYSNDSVTEDSWTPYDLFFEFGWGPSVFFCGGCNNCSGEGGRGGRELEAVFDFASAIFDKPVIDEVMPPGRWMLYQPLL